MIRFRGVLGAHMRLVLLRPGFRGLIAANGVAGASGAIARTGLDGLSPGAGLVGGLARGLGAAIVAWPMLAAGASSAVVCDRSSQLMAEVGVTCGVSSRLLYRAQIAAAVIASGVAILAAIPAAAMVGLGDALRQRGGYLGSWSPLPAAGPIVIAAAYLIALLTGLAVMARTATRLYGTLILSIAAFLAILPAAYYYRWLRIVLSASPWGPLWSSLYKPKKLLLSLPMTQTARLVVVLIWIAISALLFWVGTRPARRR